MKKLLITAVLGAFALPGCIVAVESRSHRVVHDPPPPYDPEPEVTVEWTSARTVIVREYYDCDWDTVGYFDYYERECGIPEDDLFFLLHVSRVCGRPFNEVIFTYSTCDRQLFRVVQHYRINHWDFYVDLPVGTACPPAYQRVYGYYWYRSRYPSIVLTNYDCHALFWLRFGVFYYGWQPRECFTRWDTCVDNRVSFVTVVHREYQAPRRVVVYNWARRPVTVIARQDRDVKVIENRRREVYKKVEIDCNQRAERGERVVRPLPPKERERRIADQKRDSDEERKKEVEIRRREPHKYEEYKKGDDRKDDRKDRRDDRKDDRREPPKKDDGKKDDGKKDDGKKGDGKKDDGKKKEDEKKNERKGDDRRDDRKDDREDRRDDRKKDDGKKDDGKKDDGKKDDGKKNDRKDDREDRRDDRRDDRKKDDGKKDDGKKDDGKKDDGKKDEGKKNDGKKDKQSPPRQEPRRQQEQPQRKQPERKQEPKQERKQEPKQQEKKQEQKQDDRKQDRRR